MHVFRAFSTQNTSKCCYMIMVNGGILNQNKTIKLQRVLLCMVLSYGLIKMLKKL